jgi:ADP-ribose diphosphatase
MNGPRDPRWKVKRRQSELRRPPWLEVFREQIELPDGRQVDDFYTIDMQDFAVVVALTPDEEVVVERLYRHGSGGVTWSLPAGFLHLGRSALESAVLELREETGYEAPDWIPIGRFITDGNRGCGWCNCFLARGAKPVQKPHSNDLAEVEISVLPWDRLLDLLAADGVVEMASAAAIGLAAIRLEIKPGSPKP